MATSTKIVDIKGGLNLVTPPMKRPGTNLQAVQNFRNDQDGGITRIGGYERFDGQAGPAEAVYYNLPFDKGSVAPQIGQDLVGGNSGTTAVVLSFVVNSGDWSTCDAAGVIYAVSVNGTFLDDEPINAASMGGFSSGYSSGYELGIQPNTCGQLSSVGQGYTFFNYSVPGWVKKPDVTPALPVGSGIVFGVAYNPAGSLMAIAWQTSPHINIYNAVALTQITGPSTIPATEGRCVTFNSAGTLMAVGGAFGIIVYNTSDWSVNTTLATTGRVDGLDFNQADTLLAAAVNIFSGVNLEIFDTSTWLPIAGPAVKPDGWATGVHFSPDDTLLAVAVGIPVTRNVNIYNTSTWAKLPDPPGVSTNPASACRFNHAQTELMVVTPASPGITRYNTSTWATLPGSPVVTQCQSCDWSGDDAYAAIGATAAPNLQVYDTTTWVAETLGFAPTDGQRGVTFKSS